MIQIEIMSSENIDELIELTNYFLKQLEECQINDIKYSSTAFFDEIKNKTRFKYTCFIVYSLT